MPGTEGAPDELDAMLGQLTSPDAAGTQPTPEGGTPEGADHGGRNGNAAPVDKTDYKQRYNALRPEFDKRSSKANTLDQLLKDPSIRTLAMKDPRLAEALAKVGYQQALEEQSAQDTDEDDWDGNEDDPRYQRALFSHEVRLEREFRALERSMKRDLSSTEHGEIRKLIQRAPQLTTEEAWMLTPSYRKLAKDAEDRRITEATAKGQTLRPRPPSATLPGSSVPKGQKAVSDMSEAERRAFLGDLITKNQ